MCPFERESCPFVVIEERRLPSRAGVAVRARCFRCFCKLLAMDILVATFTPGWSQLEVHVSKFGL